MATLGDASVGDLPSFELIMEEGEAGWEGGDWWEGESEVGSTFGAGGIDGTAPPWIGQ